MQMLSQLGNMHHHGMVYKYLSPKDVIVTSGWEYMSEIKIRISDIAIM